MPGIDPVPPPRGVPHERSSPVALTLIVLGAAATGVALLASPQDAADAARQSWPPFVLVAGLLLVGLVANADGLFAAAASLLSRLPGGQAVLFTSAMALVAVVTVLLNLDTAVVFLTPILVLVARNRGASEDRFLYGCVFMSNSASLLLPGSNLTNLLVLSGEHNSGAVFLQRMLMPWLAAVLVTGTIVAVLTRGSGGAQTADRPSPVRPGALGSGGVVVALALVVALGNDSALPVLALGLTIVAAQLVRRRLRAADIRRQVDVVSLAGVFGIAVALGTVARLSTLPARLIGSANAPETAGAAAILSVLVNNLPAAVLLGSSHPAHPRSLLLGLNIGPNLAVTGSLSALLWWQAAHSVDARPTAWRYSRMGLAIVPAALLAALLAGALSPGNL